MFPVWLRDFVHRTTVRKARAAQTRATAVVPYRAPHPELVLTNFWIDQLLLCEGDCIYEISRDEPFRLKHVRAAELPVTPALLNRTVTTILGVMEPEQPTLGQELIAALRAVTPETPVQLRYRSKSHHQTVREATVFDLGDDRLYVHCAPADDEK